jgi:nitroreductase
LDSHDPAAGRASTAFGEVERKAQMDGSNRAEACWPQQAEDYRGDVVSAMVGRRSVRAFLDRPVERSLVEEILDAARWAPSGANIQPWHVQVVSGEWKEKVTAAILAERATRRPPASDYTYYPNDWFEPYRRRRIDLGASMYRSLGGYQAPKMREESWNRNYCFFGAPVAMLFFIDRRLNTGSWLDYGMFLQNVMLAAWAKGLDTCPQASVADYPGPIRSVLSVPDDQLLVCSVSVGYADLKQPVNSFERTRADVSHFTVFRESAPATQETASKLFAERPANME